MYLIVILFILLIIFVCLSNKSNIEHFTRYFGGFFRPYRYRHSHPHRYFRYRHGYRHPVYPRPFFWNYFYPRWDYPEVSYVNPYRLSNPGCDNKTCGGYCTPYNSTCCGGTNPTTCSYAYCKNHTSCD